MLQFFKAQKIFWAPVSSKQVLTSMGWGVQRGWGGGGWCQNSQVTPPPRAQVSALLWPEATSSSRDVEPGSISCSKFMEDRKAVALAVSIGLAFGEATEKSIRCETPTEGALKIVLSHVCGAVGVCREH